MTAPRSPHVDIDGASHRHNEQCAGHSGRAQVDRVSRANVAPIAGIVWWHASTLRLVSDLGHPAEGPKCSGGGSPQDALLPAHYPAARAHPPSALSDAGSDLNSRVLGRLLADATQRILDRHFEDATSTGWTSVRGLREFGHRVAIG